MLKLVPVGIRIFPPLIDNPTKDKRYSNILCWFIIFLLMGKVLAAEFFGSLLESEIRNGWRISRMLEHTGLSSFSATAVLTPSCLWDGLQTNSFTATISDPFISHCTEPYLSRPSNPDLLHCSHLRNAKVDDVLIRNYFTMNNFNYLINFRKMQVS